MSITRIVAVFFLSLALSVGLAAAQGEVSSIPFESIPENTTFVGGGSAISLEADTQVTGSVVADGEIVSGTGFRFPDATVQTTAAPGAGTTANQGLYQNTIADFVPPNAYTEICIKAGAVSFDIHAASEPTTGGNCSPGDTGWVIERFERDAGTPATWSTARLECLKDGMRLLEPFEWTVSCEDAATFAISDMDDAWEWTSNTTGPGHTAAGTGLLTSMVMGNGSCAHGSQGRTFDPDGGTNTNEYRCAR